MFTDTHVHLHRREFGQDLCAVLERASAAGVNRLVNVGYDLPSSVRSVQMAASDPRFYASVGIHPHDAEQLADAQGRPTAEAAAILARLEELAQHPRVIALGEIGLDFYRDLSARPAQRAALVAQLELADRLQLPVILHIRDAYDEMIALLQSVGVPARGAVMHAFAGGTAHARWALAHGLYLGIGGPVTYKNSRLPAILSEVPAAAILLETDAPWLPPMPHRGRRNEPAYLALTAARVSELMGLSVAEFARQADVNLRTFSSRFATTESAAEKSTGG